MAEIFTYRKRQITTDDVQFVRNLIAKQPTIGRCELSRQVCRAWNWVQPNGYLKDIVCRGLLLKLEREGHLTLPPRKFTPNNPLAQRKPPEIISISQDPIHAKVKELYPVILRQVRKSTDEKLFNSLVQQFHYLGYTQPVGEHLKYIAYADGQAVACLAFSSAPYHIGPRDDFIGWDRNTLEGRRHLLAYNTRFLILPWVRVPHFGLTFTGTVCQNNQSGLASTLQSSALLVGNLCRYRAFCRYMLQGCQLDFSWVHFRQRERRSYAKEKQIHQSHVRIPPCP